MDSSIYGSISCRQKSSWPTLAQDENAQAFFYKRILITSPCTSNPPSWLTTLSFVSLPLGVPYWVSGVYSNSSLLHCTCIHFSSSSGAIPEFGRKCTLRGNALARSNESGPLAPRPSPMWDSAVSERLDSPSLAFCRHQHEPRPDLTQTWYRLGT